MRKIIVAKILISFLAIQLSANTQKQEKINQESQNFLELQEKEKEIQAVIGVTNDVKKNLNELKNMQIFMETKYISISNSPTIRLDLHPKHFTKLYFPKGAIVVESKSTQKFADNEIYSNRVELRPNDDLIQASISITYIYKKKTYDLTIIANKYDVSNNRNNSDNIFFPKISFTIEDTIKPKEIIKLYKKDYGRLPTLPFEAYRIGDKYFTITHEDFLNNDPLNKPNLFVIYNNKTYKYKISLGE